MSMTDSGTPRLSKRTVLSGEEKAASIIKLPNVKLVVENPGFQPARADYGNNFKSELTHPDWSNFQYQEIQRPSEHHYPSTELWPSWQLSEGPTFKSFAQEFRDYWFTGWKSPLSYVVKKLVSSGSPEIDRDYFRSNPAELLLLAEKEHYEKFNSYVGTTLSDAQRDLSRERAVELIPRLLNTLVQGRNYFTKLSATHIDEKYCQKLTETVLAAKSILGVGKNIASEGYAKDIHQVFYRMLVELESLPNLTPTDHYWHLAKLQDVATQQLLDILDPQKVPSGTTQEEYHIIIAALDHALGKYNLQLQGQSPPFFVQLDYVKRSTYERLNRGLLWLSTLHYNERIHPKSLIAIKSEWMKLTSDIPFAQEIDAFQNNLMHIVWQDESALSTKIWGSEESLLHEIASRTMVFSDTLARRIWWREFQPDGKLVGPFDETTSRDVNKVLKIIDRLFLIYDPSRGKLQQLGPGPESHWAELMERLHSILSK